MHFCACPIHCKVHWRVGRRLGSCRLISVQPLIGLTIRAFSIGSALWVFEVLCCLCLHSFWSNRSPPVMVDGCRSKLVAVLLCPVTFSFAHFYLALCSLGPPSRDLVVITWRGVGCSYMMRLG